MATKVICDNCDANISEENYTKSMGGHSIDLGKVWCTVGVVVTIKPSYDQNLCDGCVAKAVVKALKGY